MANKFIINWEDQTVNVSGGGNEKYYELGFINGQKKLLEDTGHGWRFVLPGVSNQEEIENELLSEESSAELGRELEAESIGKLISQKERELGFK